MPFNSGSAPTQPPTGCSAVGSLWVSPSVTLFGFLSVLPRQAWDLAVDICLSQLPTIIEEGTAFRVSPPRASCVVHRGSCFSGHLGCRAPGQVSETALTHLGEDALSRSLKDCTNQGLKLDYEMVSSQKHLLYSVAVIGLLFLTCTP